MQQIGRPRLLWCKPYLINLTAEKRSRVIGVSVFSVGGQQTFYRLIRSTSEFSVITEITSTN